MKNFLTNVVKQRYLFLMSVPCIIWLFIFSYILIWGWSMAFQNFKLGRSFWQQEWAGLRFFKEIWVDQRFWNAFRNTLGMSILGLITGMIFPILLALFINEIRFKTFKRTVQTISYLPHFISWVVVSNMFHKILSPDNGIVNDILLFLKIIDKPIHFMAMPSLFWGIITVATLWKEIGWSTIIYLAAIAGIDQELYEAATVDGCKRFRKMWHITLPCISGTIIILFIMAFGHLTQIGLERQMLMGNAMVQDVSEVIDLYALKFGISLGRFSFGTAIGVFNSIISLILLITANSIFKKTTDQSVF